MTKSVRVSDSTHARLLRICKKSESFDEVISEALDLLEKERKVRR